jgi:hypothetical protein
MKKLFADGSQELDLTTVHDVHVVMMIMYLMMIMYK